MTNGVEIILDNGNAVGMEHYKDGYLVHFYAGPVRTSIRLSREAAKGFVEAWMTMQSQSPEVNIVWQIVEQESKPDGGAVALDATRTGG